MVPKFPRLPCPESLPPLTRANLDESVVLDEDGVTGQVPMDDGGGHTSAGSCGGTGLLEGPVGN